MKFFFRQIAHMIFRIRTFNNNSIKKFSRNIRNKRILEIGSGRKPSYSVKRFFDSSNDFTQSDMNKTFGHKVIDIKRMDFDSEFDIIICMNVLEHVFEYEEAIQNIFNALRENGVAVLFVPVFYPLHDEPNDYWRFTEYSLRRILDKFQKIEIQHSGIRQYPFAYYIEATK